MKLGLLSLSLGEYNLLLRTSSAPIGTAISEDESFLLNEGFNSKLKRININKIPKTEKGLKEELKETEERVKEDRRF